LREAYAQAGLRAKVVDFIHDMRAAYAWADVAFCRAGAGTLAELTAVGKPAVVVPYPFAVDDHQTRNARVLESAGAVKVLEETQLTAQAAARELLRLRSRPDELAAMRRNSKKLGKPDAARKTARELLAMGGRVPCARPPPGRPAPRSLRCAPSERPRAAGCRLSIPPPVALQRLGADSRGETYE
jgi:UDP-N-acetylglucosamine:LPS N-acetylglucosamine transferase